jgi:hypothetical protein
MNKQLKVVILFLLLSCGGKTDLEEFKEIEFNNPYKFNSEIEALFMQDSVNPDYQLAATLYAAKGDEVNSLRSWNRGVTPPVKFYSQAKKDSVAMRFSLTPAQDYIAERARSEKIVMLNEAHHIPSHRVFAESILKGLYREGFRFFLVESLSNGSLKDSLLNKRGYPVLASGYYTESIEFGNLLREALKLGFTVLPYETTQEMGGEVREADQANNVEEIMDDHPEGKFLIYCGAGHSVEGTIKYWGGKSLAARINDLTGINPLTIDQFFQAPRGNIKYNSIFLQALDVKSTSILLHNDKTPYKFQRADSWIDLTVLHPITSNRDQFRYQEHNSSVVTIDLSTQKLDYPLMVLVYNSNESIDAGIPIKINEINRGNIQLMLQKGTYNIVLDELNGETFSYAIEVD